jgi:hypothetical protein
MRRLGYLWALLLSGCVLSTGPSGPFADLTGTWDFTGSQSAPSLTLVGTLVVTGQSREVITGTLSWEERDGLGGVQVRGGAVNGRVIGLADTDFDVTDDASVRRHLARASGDTIEGVWAAIAQGTSGQFRAIRSGAP